MGEQGEPLKPAGMVPLDVESGLQPPKKLTTFKDGDGNLEGVEKRRTYVDKDPDGKGTQLLALADADRQNLIDDYAAGLYQPRLPTTRQEHVRKFVVSYFWLLTQIAGITLDLFMIFRKWLEDDHDRRYVVLTVTSSLYLLDILLRMFATGPCEFLTRWWNRLDIVIFYSATVGFVIMSPASNVRAFRLFRILTVLNRKLRHITGQNKQRFLSVEHDLDIDLAYVTPRLIAMSVPAEDYITRLYRNDIKDVVRFFHLKHRGHYHVTNCCPEIPYNSAAFGSNPRTRRPNVEFFNIQDHTPPLMDDFLRFFKIARSWMSEHSENVLAIHCRGGKGRTGSLCCAWLLYNQDVQDAQDALNTFALQRTDITKKSLIVVNKLQGVETPSQVRYVRYINDMLSAANAYFPEPVLPPKINRMKLQKLTINNLFAKQKHEGQKLVVAIHVPCSGKIDGKDSNAAWRIIYWSPEVEQSDCVEFDLGNTVASKDTRITVFKADRKNDVMSVEGTHILAGTEPGCLFYFLFHTFFHKDDNVMNLTKLELDKAWKSSKYLDEGTVILDYCKAPHMASAARRVAALQKTMTRIRVNSHSSMDPAKE